MLERDIGRMGTEQGRPKGRKQFLCVWCFPLVVFTFLDSKLSCGNPSMRRSCTTRTIDHPVAQAFHGLPSSPIRTQLFISPPKIEMKINVFPPFLVSFFAMQTHNCIQIQKLGEYMCISSLYIVYIYGIVAVSSWSARSSPSLISCNLLLAKFIERIYRTEMPNFLLFFTVESPS